MTFEALEKAREVIGISQRASLAEIKTRYRVLVKQHHPDRNAGGGTDVMHEINAAYRLLLQYCEKYRYNFTKDEFWMQCPEERMRAQFYDHPMWGED